MSPFSLKCIPTFHKAFLNLTNLIVSLKSGYLMFSTFGDVHLYLRDIFNKITKATMAPRPCLAIADHDEV